jgi:glutamine amidotransferase
MVLIIKYGLGNIGSIYNMCKYIGSEVMISSSLDEIEKASSLILPGVGSFEQGMNLLEQNSLRQLLDYKVLEQKVPILGICLGMQLMTKGSEEGKLPGLNWIDAKCIKFKFDANEKTLKIPHIGWNDVYVKKTNSLLFPLIDGELQFYFAHSYHVECQTDVVLATTKYGHEFPVVVQRDNILGVQFHPEKSHQFGMNFLKAFTNNQF